MVMTPPTARKASQRVRGGLCFKKTGLVSELAHSPKCGSRARAAEAGASSFADVWFPLLVARPSR